MPPTNTTPATATVISSLPYTQNLALTGLGSPYTLYWQYTAASDDIAIGPVAFDTSGSGYQPKMTFYTGVLAGTAWMPSLAGTHYDTPAQIPVTNGITYWIKITPTPGTPDVTGNITVDVQKNPTSAIAANSILINGDVQDSANAPAVIIDPTGLGMLCLKRTTIGEHGAICSNNVIALTNDDTGTIPEAPLIYLYDSTVAQVTTIPFQSYSSWGDVNRFELYGDGKDLFWWLLYSDSALSPADITHVIKYNSAGTQLTDYHFTDGSVYPTYFGVSPDNTIFYYTENSGTTIRKYDTGSNTISTFATIGGGFHVNRNQAFTVLSNGDVLIVVESSTPAYEVLRYNSSGTLQATYTITPPIGFTTVSADGPRIFAGPDNLTTFWVWLTSSNGTYSKSTLMQYRVSDGTILVTITQNTFNSFLGPTESGNVNPSQRFGVASSCAIVVFKTPVVPPVSSPPGIYTPNPPPGTNPPPAHDTYFASDTTTINVKIPNPTAIIYPAGD